MKQKQDYSYTCLEEIDTFSKVTSILLKNQDSIYYTIILFIYLL